MIPRQKRKLMSKADDRVILYAGLFLVCAMLAAPVQAATQRVEGLSFDRVLVFGGVDVEISQGDRNELKMRGDEEELDLKPFLLDGETLVLGRSAGAPGRGFSDVKYKLQLESIEELGVSGSAEVYVKELNLPRLSVELEGSGEIRMFGFEGESLSVLVRGSGDVQIAKLVAQDFEAALSGSGDLEIGPLAAEMGTVTVSGSGEVESQGEGRVAALQLRIMGSGDIEFKDVAVETAEIVIMGSGDAEIGPVEVLEATIVGSGSVFYRGDADVTRNIVGSGSVEQAR